MSRLDRKVEQVLAELWWFSIELGEQTTKSNGVPELFMVDSISHFTIFAINCECGPGHSQTDWIVNKPRCHDFKFFNLLGIVNCVTQLPITKSQFMSLSIPLFEYSLNHSFPYLMFTISHKIWRLVYPALNRWIYFIVYGAQNLPWRGYVSTSQESVNDTTC